MSTPLVEAMVREAKERLRISIEANTRWQQLLYKRDNAISGHKVVYGWAPDNGGISGGGFPFRIGTTLRLSDGSDCNSLYYLVTGDGGASGLSGITGLLYGGGNAISGIGQYVRPAGEDGSQQARAYQAAAFEADPAQNSLVQRQKS